MSQPFTNISQANERIQALEASLHALVKGRREYMETTEHYRRWHTDETARYRKIASDATEKLFRQYREYASLLLVVQSVESVLATHRQLIQAPSSDNNSNIPAAVDACLLNTSSIQTERTLQEMLDHMANTCKDAGLPVEPDMA